VKKKQSTVAALFPVKADMNNCWMHEFVRIRHIRKILLCSISFQLFPDTVNSIQFTRKQKEKLPHQSGENLTRKRKRL
jgi:hypothetical protein